MRRISYLLKRMLFLLMLGSGLLFGQSITIVETGVTYATVSAALSAAQTNQTIHLTAGVYTETFNLNKNVTVRGPNHNISGTGSRAAEAIFRNAKANVTRGTLIGFRFEKSDDAGYSGDGPVSVGGTTPATVKNNVFASTTSGFSGNNNYAGIEVQMGTGNKIIDSNFFTKGSGFFVKQWRAGMWVNSTVAGFEITNNTFDNTNTALNMDYTHPGIVVEGNTFNSNNGTYVAFGGSPNERVVWGENYFPGNPGTKFNLSAVPISFRFDVTACKFNGKTGADMTLVELFNYENGLRHRGSNGKNGLIIYKADHEFVRGSGTGNTIQSAVDYADPGFTINVYQGNYNEAVTIDKDNLTFLGAQRDNDVSGRSNATASSESIVSAPNSSGTAFGTTGTGAQGLTIKGFSIRGNNGGAGILASGNVNDMHVEGNLFSSFANRISFAPSAGSQNVTFTKNRVLNTSQSGPYFPNGSTGTVSYNIIDGLSESGVILEGSGNDVEIKHNVLTNNGIGVRVLNAADAGGPDGLGNSVVTLNNLAGNTLFFKNERNVTLLATCNWYGSAAEPDPLKIDGNVNVPNYLDSDASTTTLGFVPSGNCVEPMGPIIVLDTTDTYVASYPSIQDAIDDVSTQNDYTVVVVPSDFTEPGQVVVHKSVTIRGNSTDRDDTVVRSNYNTIAGDQGANPGSAWFITDPGTEVTIKDLTLDGNGKTIFGAVRFLDNGKVENVHIRNIYHSKYKGTAVQAYNGNVDITYSKFTNIQRTGAHYSAANYTGAVVSGAFDHNEYIGKGSGDWLDNALDIGGDTNVTVTYNEISNNLGVADSDGSYSSGIVVMTLFNPVANNVVVKNNKINDTLIGMYVGWDSADLSYVEIDENDFTGNTWFIINYGGALNTVINGCNWYGTTDTDFIPTRIYGANFDSYLPSGANNTLFGFKPVDDCITCLDDPVKNLDTNKVFCSIQEAIDDLDTQGGHTITVKPGTYNEAVTIGAGLDGLTLIGSVDANGMPTSIINPGSLGDGVSTNGSHNLTIQNFEITGSTGRGIIVKNADGVLLDNLNVHHNNSDGIRVDKAINATVQNSISDNNKVGLIFYALGEIKDNIVSNARYRGIFAVPGAGGGYTTGDLLISGNEVFGNWTDHSFTEWRVGGIIYYDDNKKFNGNVTIENNVSYDNYGPGFNIYKLNENALTGLTLEISSNIAYGNKDALGRGVGDGFVLYLSNYVTVHENESYDNENAGIRISNDYHYNSFYPTSNNTLTRNIIRDNERGIYIQGNNNHKIAGIVINENAIYDNAIAGLEVSNNGAEDVDAECNWWGQASGPVAGDILITNGSAGNVSSTPFLEDGTDVSPDTGFQPAAECSDTPDYSDALTSVAGITTKENQTETTHSWWPEEVPNGYLVLDGDGLGMVVTHMTTSERNAMTKPVRGMLIYNTTEDCVQLYTGTWNCITPGDPDALRTVRVGMWTNSVIVPQAHYLNLMQQLLNPNNYGASGTFKGAEFDSNYIVDLHSTWSGLSATDLLEQYDILVVGFKDPSTVNAEKIKTFVDGGGVLLVIMDSNVGTVYNQVFGGSGTVSAGDINATATGDSVNNSVFGDARNVSISSGGNYGVGRFSESDLPAGADIFAWEDAGSGNQYPAAWSTGKGSRAYFIWGFDAMSTSMSGSGSISSDSDVFFHNMMAEMLKKKGFSAD